MKKLLSLTIITISLLTLSSIVKAEIKSEVFNYSESGKRSTGEDYTEEDSDADYTYSNYQVKFKQDLSERLGYDLSLFRHIKDYDNSDLLDNKSQIYKTNWSYYLSRQKERSLKFEVKLQYKKKSYYDSPDMEFNQFMVAPVLKFKEKDIYTVNLSGGFNRYEFLTADQKDQLKYSAKIDGYRYFLEKKFMLLGGYGIERLNHTQSDRDRTKQNVMLGGNYIFRNTYIYKIDLRSKWGKRDTKDDDERDEDSDYKYREFNAVTHHKINDKLETRLKYEYFKKDYNVLDLNHKGFYAANEYDYEIMEDQDQRTWLNFDIGRKDTRYNEKSGDDYKKTIASIQLNYKRKRNWNTSFGIESDFYKYEDADNNKKRYYAKLSGEKLLITSNLNVSIDLKYRLTHYSQKPDDKQEALRFGMSYEF